MKSKIFSKIWVVVFIALFVSVVFVSAAFAHEKTNDQSTVDEITENIDLMESTMKNYIDNNFPDIESHIEKFLDNKQAEIEHLETLLDKFITSSDSVYNEVIKLKNDIDSLHTNLITTKENICKGKGTSDSFKKQILDLQEQVKDKTAQFESKIEELKPQIETLFEESVDCKNIVDDYYNASINFLWEENDLIDDFHKDFQDLLDVKVSEINNEIDEAIASGKLTEEEQNILSLRLVVSKSNINAYYSQTKEQKISLIDDKIISKADDYVNRFEDSYNLLSYCSEELPKFESKINTFSETISEMIDVDLAKLIDLEREFAELESHETSILDKLLWIEEKIKNDIEQGKSSISQYESEKTNLAATVNQLKDKPSAYEDTLNSIKDKVKKLSELLKNGSSFEDFNNYKQEVIENINNLINQINSDKNTASDINMPLKTFNYRADDLNGHIMKENNVTRTYLNSEILKIYDLRDDCNDFNKKLIEAGIDTTDAPLVVKIQDLALQSMSNESKVNVLRSSIVEQKTSLFTEEEWQALQDSLTNTSEKLESLHNSANEQLTEVNNMTYPVPTSDNSNLQATEDKNQLIQTSDQSCANILFLIFVACALMLSCNCKRRHRRF